MIIGFGAIVSILMFGDFLQQPSANVLEDGTVDDKNIVGLGKDMKEIRSVPQGALFIAYKIKIKNLFPKRPH